VSKTDKLIARFKAAKDRFDWSDLVTLLKALDFEQLEGSGSRIKFVKDSIVITMHKPHPQKEVKAYMVK
jgi:hypothetical protein